MSYEPRATSQEPGATSQEPRETMRNHRRLTAFKLADELALALRAPRSDFGPESRVVELCVFVVCFLDHESV